MICCGESRETPFCSQCGKSLREANPLEELLAHCRKWQRIRQQQTNRMASMAEPPDDLEPTQRGLARWTCWCDALAKAIGEQAGKD